MGGWSSLQAWAPPGAHRGRAPSSLQGPRCMAALWLGQGTGWELAWWPGPQVGEPGNRAGQGSGPHTQLEAREPPGSPECGVPRSGLGTGSEGGALAPPRAVGTHSHAPQDCGFSPAQWGHVKRACRSSGLDEGGVRESEGRRRSRAPPPSQLCRDRHPGGILGEGWGSWPGDCGHEVGVQPLGSRVTWPVGGVCGREEGQWDT